METAPVRQPRVGSARKRRVPDVALGVAGAVLAASAVLLQPFTATYVLPPGRLVSPPVAVVPPPAVPATAAIADLPSAAAPATLVAPPRPAPVVATTSDAIEPPVATSGSVPSAGAREPTAIVVAPVAGLPGAPESRLPAAAAALPPSGAIAPPAMPAPPAVSPATAAPQRGRQPTAAAVSAAPATPPAEPPHGPPPPPREPLPLQTDLIAPGSAEPVQTARPDAVPSGIPSAIPGAIPGGRKPAAADRHG